MGEMGGWNLLKTETTFKNPSYSRVNTVRVIQFTFKVEKNFNDSQKVNKLQQEQQKIYLTKSFIKTLVVLNRIYLKVKLAWY